MAVNSELCSASCSSSRLLVNSSWLLQYCKYRLHRQKLCSMYYSEYPHCGQSAYWTHHRHHHHHHFRTAKRRQSWSLPLSVDGSPPSERRQPPDDLDGSTQVGYDTYLLPRTRQRCDSRHSRTTNVKISLAELLQCRSKLKLFTIRTTRSLEQCVIFFWLHWSQPCKFLLQEGLFSKAGRSALTITADFAQQMLFLAQQLSSCIYSAHYIRRSVSRQRLSSRTWSPCIPEICRR